MARALFLDRDGVINHEAGYLYRSEEVRFVDGIFALCQTAQRLGYYTTADFDRLMTWMSAQFRTQGVELDAIYHCPYHPEHGVGEFKRDHEDRKPSPGMLLRGAREFGLDLARSLMVGDRCSDVGAANAAGLGMVFLIAGTELRPCTGAYAAVAHLAEVEQWLKAQEAERQEGDSID
jgi:D-glycero-D-manno-heptose 1,7-bisphosphate phosphatase